MRASLLFLFFSSYLFSQTTAPIVFSEIMFRPAETNSEFIELFNTSDTNTVDLTKYQIQYHTSAADTIVSHEAGLVLQPQQYAVILEGDYNFANGIYQNLIPAGALVLTIDNNTFGSSGMSNSSDRTVRLINAVGDTLISRTYTANNSAGISDEKILMNNDNASSNWANSLLVNGTPGFANTVSPLNNDLLVASIRFLPETPHENDLLSVSVLIKNIGLNNAANFTVEIFNDINADSIAETIEKIFNNSFTSLSSGDSLTVQTEISNVPIGTTYIIAQINYSADENTANDTAFENISVLPKPAEFSDFVINEIMYKPLSGEPEWIEIFNRSNEQINLKSWRIFDASSSINITDSNVVVEPNEYVVIADDNAILDFFEIPSKLIIANIPSLNNSGDNLKIKDGLGNVIDSVNYLSDWGDNQTGISLERLDTESPGNIFSNWSSSTASSLATPGEINSVTPKNIDLAITDFYSDNEYAELNSPTLLNVKVINSGIQTADNITVRLFNDTNRDGFPQPSEKVDSVNISTLNSNDSLIVYFNFSSSIIGENYLIAEVHQAQDEFAGNNSMQFVLDVVEINEQRNDLVINEIMYAPSAPEPEWIEIFNRSSKTIDLRNYQIADSRDTVKVIHKSTLILPDSFFVVAKDSSFYEKYGNTPHIVISFFPSLNNSNDKVIILDSLFRVIDSVSYSSAWGGTSGKSLERINSNAAANDSTNWNSSISPKLATPGLINSVTRRDYDLAVTNIYSEVDYVELNSSVQLNVQILNTGIQTANNITVRLFNDINKDNIPQPSEKVDSVNVSTLNSNDSLIVNFNFYAVELGTNNLIAEVYQPQDEFATNNKMAFALNVVQINEERNDLVINEIMYAPSAPEPEWIEIFNKSSKIINLRNYQIADSKDTVHVIFANTVLPPDSFFVVAKDSSFFVKYGNLSNVIISSFPSLNNSNDDVIILDSLSRVIDSVSYSSDWGGSGGKSLERINSDASSNDSANWGSSVSENLATPEMINSITQKNFDLAITDFYSDADYVLLNNSALLNVKIQNIGIETANNITVRLFNDINNDEFPQPSEKIDSMDISALSSNDSITVNFNFNGVVIGTNNLIAQVYQPQDKFSANNEMFLNLNVVEVNEQRNDLAINEIMYAPSSPEPEWIEIFNRSGKTIDLRNYEIADSKDTVQVIFTNTVLPPDSFFVVAKDSSFFVKYGNLSNVIISSFPSLNNSNDDVIILDSLSRVTDSVSYSSDWGGTGGKSLERINSDASSNDSTNWGSSVSNPTPGKNNSIAKNDFDISVESAFPNPAIPTVGNDVHLSAFLKNRGKLSSSFTIQLFYDNNFDNIADELVETTSNLSIQPNDSIIINFNYFIHNIQSEKDFVIIANLLEDENNLNDTLYFSVRPSFGRNAIQINEIMYRPANGEPEWIEFYNSSDSKINFKNWTIGDIETQPDTTIITSGNIFIQPKSLFVIAKDSVIQSFHSSIPSGFAVSAFPNLNNNTDGVVLRSQYGLTIDSLKYNTNWENKLGFSIERISRDSASVDSSNWVISTDVEQSTPGRINSAAAKKYDLQILDISAMPKFPGKDADLKLTTIIVNNGLLNAANFSVKLFYGFQNASNLLEEFTGQTLASGDSLTVLSDKTFKLTETMQIAAQVEFADDENTANNFLADSVEPGFLKGSLLISEVMIEPLSGNPEWIEFKNVSGKDIDLNNWVIGNLLPSLSVHTIIDSSAVLKSNQFLVLASDSLLAGIDSTALFINAKIGGLNNTADGIVIYDFRHAVIDSLFYDNSYDIEKGFSLERISLSDSTNNPLNWLSSIEQGGGTPGFANSVSALVPQKKKSVVINEIMYNPFADNSEFIELYNTTDKYIELGGFGVFDHSGNFFKITDKETELPPDKYFVAAADSLILQNYTFDNLNNDIYITNSSKFNLSSSNEDIILVDAFGNVVDSVAYDDKWNNRNIVSTRNKSLERLNPNLDSNDPDNWSTSVNPNGATPGKQNSVFVKSLSASTKISINPNPFSPDNDGFEDFSIVHYNLTQTVAQIRIKVFDSRGRKVRTIVSNRASGSSGSVIFDGLDDNGKPLRIGIYILFIEALNGSSGVVETLKEPIVIARKL